MVKCPVCGMENSEEFQKCKNCSFTLKYVKEGRHINISNNEVKRYKKSLEEAKKEKQ